MLIYYLGPDAKIYWPGHEAGDIRPPELRGLLVDNPAQGKVLPLLRFVSDNK